jgi:outer membrane receptor protein involved in Fe transport
LDASLQNIARERVQGVDLAIDYRVELGDSGSLSLGGQASYLDSERQISAGQAVLRRAGMVFNPPHWRWRLGGTFERRNTALSMFLNSLGGTLDDRFGPDERIGGFVTVDASFRLRSNAARGPLRNVELRLSAQNLLDEVPSPIRDPDPAAPPYDSTNQSPVGRFISLSITKRW